MRHPTAPLVALSIALLAVAGAPSLLVAQNATPAASPGAETVPFAGQGITYEVTAEVPAANPADGYTLQLGELGIDPTSEGVERTSDDAEALTIEEGFVVFALIALEGQGRVVTGDEETECPNDGCDLADFVGQEIVLGPGATVTHGGLATYALRPFDIETIPAVEEARSAAEATPAAGFPVFPMFAAGGRIRISHACGGRCS